MPQKREALKLGLAKCGVVMILGSLTALCVGQASLSSGAHSRGKPRVFIEWRGTGVFVAQLPEHRTK
jgi:hypothetical protein